ncbi:MAG: 2-C-methyl-D-erythritol 2,4-cyclodiphosphate synthase [Chlamydiia bacterium]|nr:2-C-methyl-D-erythritol 2,4-cyclodiphosphate synthase [Chlamydiia bacterium]
MRTGLGQDSHRFLNEPSEKNFIIGGVVIDDAPGLDADSDGDVVLHAICNAITSLTGVPILGGIAPKMCKQGITNSAEYLKEAVKTLGNSQISHIALSVEAKRPRLEKHIPAIRANVAKLLGLELSQVGMTCTSGDGLTDFGRGDGLQCLCILSLIDIKE